ncbi:hypothetical protein PGTUg99_009200 [Puccinia graminis f. sp. tritici]|uniref:Uncharacterized protein n=1 Tax=Puccinia graminis f. sp. tritici TaxID=56615 RepID=A0A5B0NR76_PUCGR|nr:hypothetical protein PGTUg99_009200 [Puccinia graminis f. sp. tritici]
MTNEQLSCLSKLALALHPTNCRSSQELLLLYSSVIGEEIWHLSLIGPTVPENPAGPRETWWEGKWSMEELQDLVPSKSRGELIDKIRSSFRNDDITLIGYREGNEAEVRVTIGYSTSGAFTISLARLNSANEPSPTPKRKPFLNLLSITCEAYQQLNNRKHEKHIDQAQSGNSADHDINRTMIQSSYSRINAASDNRNAPDQMKRTNSVSSPNAFADNLAHSSKKARIAVTNRFLDSDESD